ncbi:MAG: TrmH family RNA methyltransferase [Acidobacteriota bacterium]
MHRRRERKETGEAPVPGGEERLLPPGTARRLSPYLLPGRLQRLEEVLASRTGSFVLVLDRLYDPHNLSAILRTAEAFGLQEVHLAGSFPDRLNPQVALGAERWLTVRRWPDPTALLAHLQERGFLLAVTVPGGEGRDPSSFDPPGPTALVLGNEHDGVSDLFLRRAQAKLTLPLRGFSQSLNVSVAAGIFLWALAGRPALRLPLEESRREALRDRWVYGSLPRAEEILRHLDGVASLQGEEGAGAAGADPQVEPLPPELGDEADHEAP